MEAVLRASAGADEQHVLDNITNDVAIGNVFEASATVAIGQGDYNFVRWIMKTIFIYCEKTDFAGGGRYNREGLYISGGLAITDEVSDGTAIADAVGDDEWTTILSRKDRNSFEKGEK